MNTNTDLGLWDSPRSFKKIPIGLFVSCAVIFGALVSCKSTVETHDVIKYVHDTVGTNGPALVRFISMISPRYSPTVVLRKDSLLSSPIVSSAETFVDNSYIPVPDSSPVTYWANFKANGLTSTLPVHLPSLAPDRLSTCAIFVVQDHSTGLNQLNSYLIDDSLKLVPAPTGYCYLRLLNGLPDFPSPSPMVNIFLDTSSTPIFLNPVTRAPSPVFYLGYFNYVPIPSGFHYVNVKSPNTGQVIYSPAYQFIDGEYYTAKLTGSRADSTDRFSIDQE